jgi:hypothetical protein
MQIAAVSLVDPLMTKSAQLVENFQRASFAGFHQLLPFFFGLKMLDQHATERKS